MKVQNLVMLTALGISSVAFSSPKSHPYNRAFETKVSTMQVDDYIARLQKKYAEVSALKQSKDGSESDSALALRSAVGELQQMKLSTSFAEKMDHAYGALDLESSVRIQGDIPLLQHGIDKVTALLSHWKISLRSDPSAEASNLYNPAARGYLSESDVQSFISTNADLSTYQPKSSTFWQAQENISQVNVEDAAMGRTLNTYRGSNASFPTDKTYFYDEMKYADTKPKFDAYIRDAAGNKVKYKLKFGGELHAESTVAAIMMTLGFPTDIDKYERGIKVILGKTTLDKFKRDWNIYYDRDMMAKEYPLESYIDSTGVDPQLGNYIVFKEGVIEARPQNIGRLGGWSFTDNGNDSLREVRGLLFVQLFMSNTDVKLFDNQRTLIRQNADGTLERTHIISDLGYSMGGVFEEMPDNYAGHVVSSRTDKEITLNYHLSQVNPLREKITYADAKWTSRLIAGLTRTQIETAVRLGGWDPCVQKIYVEKIIMRRNDLIRNFELSNELLPVRYSEDELKLKKVCDLPALEANSTSTFKFDAAYLLKPAGRIAWNYILDQARSVGGSRRLHLLGSQFDHRLQGIVDVLVTLGTRKVERNPHPTGAGDLYIVKDSVEIGLRTGLSYGVYVDAIVKRTFTLTYPVGSVEESRSENKFIFNVLLMNDVAHNRVPEKYVLKTEFTVEDGVGFDMDRKTDAIAPLAIRSGVAKVRVMRTVLDHRDANKILLFRDVSKFTQEQLELFARLAIFKIPLFQTVGQHSGKAVGRALTVDASQITAMPGLWNDIKVAALDGDFASLTSKEIDVDVENDFSSRASKWGLLLWRSHSAKRLEYIRIDDKLNEENSRTILQSRETKSNSTIDKIEEASHAIKVEVFSNPNETPQKFRINVQVMGTNKKTDDAALSENFLGFINGLSTTGSPFISFSPELGYSTNGKWGALTAQSNTTYYQEGIDRVLSATPDELLNAIATTSRISVADLQAYMSSAQRAVSLAATGGRGVTLASSIRQSGLNADQFELARHTAEFLTNLKQVSRADSMEKKVKRVSELFREAVYLKSTGYFDPRIMGAMNRLVGTNNFYASHIITTPPATEVNLVEEAPLTGEEGTSREGGPEYLMYAPQTGLDQYFMFDSWF